MEVTPERRRAPRKKVSLAVLCRSGIERGSATIVNVSISGALLEPASIRPERGAVVKVLLSSPDAGSSGELSGIVVRHTEVGFAIQFLAENDTLRELVGEAA